VVSERLAVGKQGRLGGGERPDGKGTLERPSCRWEDNIKIDLQEVKCGSMDCNELAQEKDR